MKTKVLVTGGNGFLALWVIKDLLEQAYAVRATLRSLAKADEVRQTLRDQGVDVANLSFVAADLTQMRAGQKRCKQSTL